MLPELIGTDKQVRWANNIRKALLVYVRDNHPGSKASILQSLMHKTDAAWFIENRILVDLYIELL